LIPDGSSFGSISAFQQLVNAGQAEDMFAMCINQTNGGVLTLGGVDSSLYSGEVQWTRRGAGFGYRILVTSVSVNDQQLDLSSHQHGHQALASMKATIIDSGTNVWLTPTALFQNIQHQVQSFCPFPVEGRPP
jgi:Eukaryotic aspartyl protease